jgi:hypothetical protein
MMSSSYTLSVFRLVIEGLALVSIIHIQNEVKMQFVKGGISGPCRNPGHCWQPWFDHLVLQKEEQFPPSDECHGFL